MEKRLIPFSPPDITEEEIQAVAECLRSGWITTGPRTKQLEKELAEYIGTEKVVCLNSATAAEELNLRILGIRPGDEVLVPAYTYSATAAAAIHVGAKVIFIDSQTDSLEMDYEQMAKKITCKTKAIIPVDIGGIPCDYESIFKTVEAKKDIYIPLDDMSSGLNRLSSAIQKAIGRVAVIADCAHSLGTYVTKNEKKTMCGAIADFSSFSFHAVKNFTTAEGGAATWKSIEGINSEEIYHWYQLLSLHGQSKDALAKTKLGSWEYDVVAPFYKCNMTDIMAAIGLKQLERYPKLLTRRAEIIKTYDKCCEELGIDHVLHFTNEYTSCGHLYITRVTGCSDDQRREIISKMAERGVATNVHYKPLPMMTAYKFYGWNIKDFPNAYKNYENAITLPVHTLLTNDDVIYICNVFKDAVKEVKKTR